MFSPAPPTLAVRLPEQFSSVMDALCRAAAARAARNWAAAPLVLLLWPYLRRLARRFETLATRVQAGRMVTRSARPQTARAPSSRRPGLPHGFAWLLRLVPEAVCLRGQLQHLLADPDMTALIATTPQVAGMLRPLCRMLGLSPGPELPPALWQPHSPRQPGQEVHEKGKPLPPAVQLEMVLRPPRQRRRRQRSTA